MIHLTINLFRHFQIITHATPPPPPLKIWPHLFSVAGRENTTGQYLNWPKACTMYIGSCPCAQPLGPVHTARLGWVYVYSAPDGPFLPARKRATCYDNVDGWQAGLVGVWLSVTAGIVSERLNLFQNCLDHLVAPSFKDLVPLTPIPNSKGNLFSAGIKYTVDGKTGDFSTIFNGYRRLSRKRCAIGRRLLRNVNRNSCVPDWMT